MKKASKLILMILAVMVMLTVLLPTEFAFAAEASEEVQIGRISERQLDTGARLNASGYATTRAAAARELRAAMVARKEEVTIAYKAEIDKLSDVEDDIVDTMEELYHRAIAHTGEPDEGDSLKWCLNKVKTSAEYYIKSGACYMQITYKMSYYTTARQEAALTEEVERLVKKLQLDEAISDYQKICKIYEYITDTVDYDYDHYGDDRYLLKYTAYAAALNKQAVCQGYCTLFYRLALEAGIDARFVAGTGRDEGHAWNIVALNGKYYLLDTTWDAGRSRYAWFLKGTDDFTSHTDSMGADFWRNYPLSKTSYTDAELTAAADAATGKPVLSWQASAPNYEIWCATAKNGTYTKLATQSASQYTHTQATVGTTYYYKVRAVAADGTRGSFGNVACIVCDCAAPVVSLTVNEKDGKPFLRWSAVTGAETYEVYRATSQNGTYSKMYTTAATCYTNTSASAGATYYYKVRAISAKSRYADSAFSKVKIITCDCAQPTVTATTAEASGKPSLAWEAVAGASQYEIYRANTKNGIYTKMYTTAATRYTNTSATAGYVYYYKVRAICAKSAYGNGAFSAVQSARANCARPSVTAATTASTGKPQLTWGAVAGAERYEIYRATAKNGSYTKLWTTSSTRYTNTSAEVGKTYYYKVVAVSAVTTVSNSAASTVREIVCDCAQPVVSVTRNANGQPKLTWAAVEGVKSYEIYRAISENGIYTKMYTTTATSYTNTSVSAGTTYYYKVRALCARSTYGNSADSVVKSIMAR